MTVPLLALVLLGAFNDQEVVSFQRAGADGCSFTVEVSEPSYRSIDGRWFPVIHGMWSSHEQEEYVLPSVTVYVPIPPDCTPTLRHSAHGRIETYPPGPLLVAPFSRGSGLETVWISPPPSDASFPDEVVSMRTMRLAGTRVAAVTVSPFGGTDAGSIPSRISVDLSWPATAGSRRIESGILDAVTEDGLPCWPVTSPPDADSPFWGLPWARMAVSTTGIYVVTGNDLEDAGISITGAPSPSLRVFSGPGIQFEPEVPEDHHDLMEIPVEVMDGGDGTFDGSDTLKFTGLGLERFDISGDELQRLSHRYASHNVYWLTWGGGNGLRVDTLDAIPDGSPQLGDSLAFTLWQEQDYFWVCGQETRTGWVWTQLFENIPAYFYFSTPSADASGRVSFSLVPENGNGGPHSVVADLNGTLIADTTWAGGSAVLMSFDGLELDPSMNLLKITATNTPGKLYLDHLMADYPRRLSYAGNRMLRFNGTVPGRYSLSLGGAGSRWDLLDLTDPLAPARLRGELSGAYLDVSLDLHQSSQLWLEDPQGYMKPDSIVPAQPGRIVGTGMQGDVAVVVADRLMEAAEPLETIYAARGLTPVMVTAGEVYEEFGQGLRDPGAIRSFFRYTQDHWDPPAASLLLVGDGTYDPMMHITSRPTLIPVFLTLYGEEGVNLDDYFVIAHEGGTLPEAPVSRITASTGAELSAYISKLMTYADRDSPGQWENRIVLAADDEWGKSSVNEYMHTLACEEIADSILPPGLDREKFYLIEYPWPPGTTPTSLHPEKPEAHEDFIDLLSRGCSSMIFFGHGSYGQLAHEKLLVSSDVQLIDNGNRQPVMIFASCDLGHFDMISADCLAEDFQLIPGSGSIASIGATRKTFSGGNQSLFSAYYQAQYGGGGLSVGDALWVAKVMLAPASYSNSKFYVVLGDGGVLPVHPSTVGCSFQVTGDTLRRGNLNSITGSFRNSSTGFANVTESGAWATFSGLGTGSLDYLRYGSSVYRGLVTGDGSGFALSFFLPVQADTGSYSRGSSVGVSRLESESAWNQWLDVVDDGDYISDSLPPHIEIWLDGHRGEENPAVSGRGVLRAILSDSSGICAMGGGAGRSVLLSIDDQGFDVSEYFTYRPDSYTMGELEYQLPEMGQGEHRLIMVAWDGMGNAGRDTLDFTVMQQTDELMTSVFVFPNPGFGQRCFNLQASSSGTATVKIYTVAGRCIWSRTQSCQEGYNQVLWDGRDMDGDRPASGPYIYRVDYSAPGGASASFTEVLAVMEEP